MRIAVFTLTRERLDYTKVAFESLKSLAGCGYDHYIVDNGSEDGTVAWLQENRSEFKELALLPKNLGISAASNLALDYIERNGPYDLIVKMDNDCVVLADDILKHMASLYERFDLLPTHVLGARVVGIVNQPKRLRNTQFGQHTVGYTGIIGGIFQVVPYNLHRFYRYPTTLTYARGQDSHICTFMRSRGVQCGYVENLAVEHIDTTDGQARRYPEYFKRKAIEETTVPA